MAASGTDDASLGDLQRRLTIRPARTSARSPSLPPPSPGSPCTSAAGAHFPTITYPPPCTHTRLLTFRDPGGPAGGCFRFGFGWRNASGQAGRQAVFGITSNMLVRSSQRPAWAGTAAPRRLLAGARTAGPIAADIIAARARSESLLRHSDVSAHIHTSHAPPPEQHRARIIWRT